MEENKKKIGRPKVEPKERVQCYLSKETANELYQMVEYLGRGSSKSDYFRIVLENHLRDMEPVLKAVRAGLLIPHYNKTKAKMMFIKREDYQKGIDLRRSLIVDR